MADPSKSLLPETPTLTAARQGGAMRKYYREALRIRGLSPDDAQLRAVERLQGFFDDLVEFKHRRRNRVRKLLVRPPLPLGIYLWGGVGRGKSFLMDCFYGSLPYVRKRRVHFHAFMREVQEELVRRRGEDDPLLGLTDRIARQTRVMCFDEFHVSDIADAMILGRLLTALLERGVVFCLTSNYPPDGLYPNGLQRENFLPAIELLNDRFQLIEVDAGIDYRLRQLQKLEKWLMPPGPEADARLSDDFQALARGLGHDHPLRLFERDLPVRRRGAGVVWFDFHVLCGGPRSQVDYLEIARDYHTVLLSGVPVMSALEAAEARRFTWLVDVLYEHRCKLIATAEADKEALYREGPNAQEFPRTVSRLMEMRTEDYLAAAHRTEAAPEG